MKMQSEALHVLQYTYTSLLNPAKHPWDHYGRSPLHYAVGLTTAEALEFLLQLKWYDVNHADCLHQTPLQKAMQLVTTCYEEQVQKHYIVALLLNSGANPNIWHTANLSPLMIAAFQQEAILVYALLLAGADPNARLDTDGLFWNTGESALSLLARNHLLFFQNQNQHNESQLQSLNILIQCPTMSPNTIFHALQKAKDPVVRSFIRHSLRPRPFGLI